jgi:cysteine desulfurase
MAKKILYLDNAATTCVDKEVAKKVERVFLENYGNASSQHQCGKKAREELEKAREKIADFINAKPNEIIFTSGGSESNNLAIKGLAFYPENKNKKHIIISQIEHPAILETCKDLEKQGYKIDYVSVNADGIVDVNEIKKKIKQDTLLVSIMHVNNEIGTIQPVEEIGRICQKEEIYFHSDCVQSFAKLNIDVEKMNVDMISVSGHKVHAPKGVGFLYIREGVKISPIIHGGGQENNLRSGTENVPGIVGLAAAIDLKKDKNKIKKMRDKILNELLKIQGAKLNGSKEKRIYNNINISFYGIEGESLMMLLDKAGICVSTGSACSSHKLEESQVLKAIGVDEMHIHGNLRISLDEINEKDAEFVIREIKAGVEKLNKMSPFKFKLNQEEK